MIPSPPSTLTDLHHKQLDELVAEIMAYGNGDIVIAIRNRKLYLFRQQRNILPWGLDNNQSTLDIVSDV